MPEPDLDSVSGLYEGKSTYDNHDDIVRDVRDYASCLDLSIPPVGKMTPNAPTLDFADRIRETSAEHPRARSVVVQLLPRPPRTHQLQPRQPEFFVRRQPLQPEIFVRLRQPLQPELLMS